MRFSSWSLWAVVLMASVAVAAQESKEDQAAPAAESKEASDDNPAEPSDEKSEAPADEKPVKKSPKKGIGLKVANEDDTKVVKTLSYMQGFGMGQQLHQQFSQQGVVLDEEVFFAALKEGMAGKEPAMSEEEMKTAMTAIQKYLGEKYAANAKEQAAKNKEEGATFLAENKKKEGVKTLPSGLQYKVIKSGKGETPKRTDTVKVHYKGSFVSGKEFESSYKGNPVPLSMDKLVKGMSEGLQLMKVGDKWQLFLPSHLAYGEQGNGRVIPPNATLVFEVELLSIEKGSKPPAGPPGLKSGAPALK